jgi:chromosome segregation ATPase
VEVDKPDAATEVAAAVEDVSNGAIQLEGESSPMPRASTDTTTSKPKASTEAGGSQSLEVPDIASRPSDVSREQQILADADREEEIHGYIERIDALQAKLQYLAQESAEKARKAGAEAPAGTLEKNLAEKDEQIALLMEEGQKLSKTELKHMTAIKKLRAKSQESERATADVAKKMEKLEKENSDLAERLKAAEAAQKQVGEKQRQVDQLRKENDKLRSERDSRDVFIASLKSQIAEAASEAKANESKKTQELLDTEKKKVANLEEEVSTVKIERELAEQKLRAQIDELRAKNERELERARATETELKGEIQMLEGRLEVMRARTEEVSSGAIGDSQAKLLRQIETLQTQYSVASDNWQGIESSLNSRIALLQKEKDEALKREADIKKKAREMVSLPFISIDLC